MKGILFTSVPLCGTVFWLLITASFQLERITMSVYEMLKALVNKHITQLLIDFILWWVNLTYMGKSLVILPSLNMIHEVGISFIRCWLCPEFRMINWKKIISIWYYKIPDLMDNVFHLSTPAACLIDPRC